MEQVIIMIGLPGAGKTTWIREHAHGDAIRCSADDYHTRNGVYDYVPSAAPAAHDKCLLKFTHLVGLSPAWASQVIVDNTNLLLGYLSPYVYQARARGYMPYVVWVNEDIEVCKQRNAEHHKVPDNIFEKMVFQLEELIRGWPLTVSWPELGMAYPDDFERRGRGLH